MTEREEMLAAADHLLKVAESVAELVKEIDSKVFGGVGPAMKQVEVIRWLRQRELDRGGDVEPMDTEEYERVGSDVRVTGFAPLKEWRIDEIESAIRGIEGEELPLYRRYLAARRAQETKP